MPFYYCNSNDLVTKYSENRLIQLTDFDEQTGDIVWAKIDQAIEQAEGYINGRLAGSPYRASVPWESSVPDQVADLAADLTFWFLGNRTVRSDVNWKVIKDFVDDSLAQIVQGQMALTVSGVPVSITGTFSTTSGQGYTFTRNFINAGDRTVESYGTMDAW